jgi:acyl dehydratase
MAKRIINNYQEFEALLGQEIGVSDYITITQEQINKFADATWDHQWIHIDPERAGKHSVNPVLFLRKIVFFYQSFS